MEIRKMNKITYYILIAFLLLSGSLFAQNEFVRTKGLTDSLEARQATIQANSKNFIKDSLDIIRASVATKLTATDTSSLSNRINTKITSAQASSLIADSTAKYIPRNFVSAGLLTPTDADYIPIVEEGDGSGSVVYYTTPSALPASTDVVDKISTATVNMATTISVQDLQDQIIALSQRFDDSVAVLKALIGTTGNPLPLPPTNLIATGTTTDIGLTWTASASTFDSVAVYRSINQYTGFSIIAYVHSGTDTYTDASAITNTIYWYQLRAINSDVYSSASNTDSAYIYQGGGSSGNNLLALADFEEGNVSDLSAIITSNGTVTATNTNPKSGSYAMLSKVTSNGGTAYGILTGEQQGVGTSVWARVDIYGGTMGSTSTTDQYYAVMSFGDSLVSYGWKGLSLQFRINASKQFYSARMDGTFGSSTTPSATTLNGAWNTIIMQVTPATTASSNDGSYKVYINGTLKFSQSGLDIANGSTSTIQPNKVRVGLITAVTGIVADDSLKYDNIAFASDSISLFDSAPIPPASAENGYFVDANATGSNNGTSWADAWTSFSAINWSIITAGDTIFVSGGTDSTIYNETLTIGKSGTSGNNIVVTKGISTGHNGNVIIDGQGTRLYNVNFGSYQYVTTSYLTVRNATSRNINLRTSNCIVSHCTFYISGTTTCGIDIRGSNNIIEYNTSNTATGGGQQDFVQCTSGGNHIFRYNYIQIQNADITQHCDGLQFYSPFTDGMTMQIYGNTIWQDNTKTTNAQGIYIEGLAAGAMDNTTWYIYNNLLIAPYAKSMIAIRNNNAMAQIYNNTIYQGSGVANAGFWIQDDFTTSIDNIIIKNNIFYSASTSVEPINIVETLGTGCDVTNNLIYSPMSNPIRYLGSARSLATWNAYSFVGTDIAGDPNFTNISTNDFTVQAGSPAIDAGVTLGSPYNVDILGVSRPQGAAYDIGAYEQ